MTQAESDDLHQLPERPKLKRDWVNRTVKIKKQLQTNEGTIFDIGTDFLVMSYYRGLELKTIEVCDACKGRRSTTISRVPLCDVELLP